MQYLFVDNQSNEVVTKPHMVGKSFNVTLYLRASSAAGKYGQITLFVEYIWDEDLPFVVNYGPYFGTKQ